VKDLIFTSANTGTAVGALGLITRTTDGGVTWTDNISLTANWLYGVAFRNTTSGFAVGGAGIITEAKTP
jgi:photosystem II stability/assembly factor-like uncharacterized protein